MLASAWRPTLHNQFARLGQAWSRGLARHAAPVTQALLLTLTVMACLLRAAGLPSSEGTLQRDESRLALSARAILERGVPLLPGGSMYTRGLLPAYVEAASFAVFGISDESARLGSIIAGTLAAPATFWLARGLTGRAPALVAAAIVAVSPPLVSLSREAWFYPWLVLWFVLALGALMRWHRCPRLELRLLSVAAYAAAIFSHELAVLFVPMAALADLSSIRPRSHRAHWREIFIFWLLITVVTITAIGLSLLLRARTAGGATVEIDAYLRPVFDARGLQLTLRQLGAAQLLLLPLAASGLAVLAARHHPLRAAWRWLPFAAVAILLIFDGFFLTRRGHPRDIQVLLPLLAVCASYASWRIIPPIVSTLCGGLSGPAQRALGATVLLALLTFSVNPPRLTADYQADSASDTWLNGMTGFRPEDLVVSFAPTISSHYLGRTDFWIRPSDYAKYVWAGRAPFRDIYSGAVVIRNAREVDSILAASNGRIAWIIIQDVPPVNMTAAYTEMRAHFAPYVTQEYHAADGTAVLRLQL